MTLTLHLTPEQEQRLRPIADRQGIPAEDFVLKVLDQATEDNASEPPLGARLLAKWQREGIIGTFSDRPDSPEFARELRIEAEDRTR
jgi:hypothetical protein